MMLPPDKDTHTCRPMLPTQQQQQQHRSDSIESLSTATNRRQPVLMMTSNSYFIYGAMLLVCVGVFSTVVGGTEYCLAETFNVSCPQDEVLMMTSALYGRMRSGRCIRADIGHMGCQADVTAFLEDECSGRQRCQFPVARLLTLSTPCHTDVASYLDASFNCVKVSTAGSKCSSDGYIHLLDSMDGYIPLSLPPAAAASRRCPWKITVDHNQRLEFSLLAFGLRQQQQQQHGVDGRDVSPGGGVGGAAAGIHHCPWSIVFEEGEDDIEESLCRSSGHQVALYTSSTNTVTAHLMHKQNVLQLPGIYLLKYEALGCPQLKVSDNVWVQQDATTAKVKCNTTEETWFLACSGRQWAGELGNCSTNTAQTGAAIRDTAMSNASVAGTLPYGFVVAVIIGVVLGVIIGAIPLGLVYMCLKRKWKRQPPIYMHDAGFYPDIQHVIQTDDEMTRSCSTYPALVKSTGTMKHSDSPGVHCCPGGQPYTDIYRTVGGGFHSPVSDPPDGPTCWDGRHTMTSRVVGNAGCCRLTTDCPVTTTLMAQDGTLLRSTLCGLHDHVYESASYPRNRCQPLDLHQQSHQQHQPDQPGTPGSDTETSMLATRSIRAPGQGQPPIVYYEVDSSSPSERKGRAMQRPGVDVVQNCRAVQSVI